MPKFTRLTSQYVRRELLRLLRRKYLPLLARHIYRQPAARREPKAGQLSEYERQLKAWKRRRTIARGKVAKYARLVRYHRKPREKQPSDQ